MGGYAWPSGERALFQSGTRDREFANTEILPTLPKQESIDNKRDSEEALPWHWSVACKPVKGRVSMVRPFQQAFTKAVIGSHRGP